MRHANGGSEHTLISRKRESSGDGDSYYELRADAADVVHLLRHGWMVSDSSNRSRAAVHCRSGVAFLARTRMSKRELRRIQATNDSVTQTWLWAHSVCSYPRPPSGGGTVKLCSHGKQLVRYLGDSPARAERIREALARRTSFCFAFGYDICYTAQPRS